jgi:cyanate permease
MGFIYDRTGSYSTGFYILIAMLVATGILAFVLRGQPKPAAQSVESVDH